MDTEKNNQPSKQKKERSAAYPSSSLPEAVELLKKLHIDLGKGPYDRTSAAKSLGYKGVSGASAMKIATLVHFGLIERVGGGYRETDLGNKLALPMDRSEETDALKEAFMSPTLFSRLMSEYQGKSIPQKLDIILTRQYKITEKVSHEAAKVFRESAEFVGLLENGFLKEIDADITDSIDENKAMPVIEDFQDTPVARPVNPGPKKSSPNFSEYAISVGDGLKVVFAQDLMLDVATGKFSKGIEQLKKDLSEISGGQDLNIQPVVKDEEAE